MLREGPHREDLAATLTILRTIRHMTQTELAEAAGVTNSAISDYEHGRVDPQTATLFKLVRALRLPISVLEQAQAFIHSVRSQTGDNTPRPVAVDPEEAMSFGRDLSTEVALLAMDGSRFVARFIRLLFVVLGRP
jgi:transcriptional regulator with XRE-family HTH domain